MYKLIWIGVCFLDIIQDAQLSQRDRATRYLSKVVLCFTRYGVRKV